MKSVLVACLLTLFGLAVGALAKAADPTYLGNWKISGAVAAPWADTKQKPAAAEPLRLLGKTVMFRPREVAGPPPFACKAPHYKESDYSADMLFQGAFEEMRSKNKSVDPNQLAASLGFAGTTVRTLETGCEIDFHFVDAATAEIGLNEYVYTLKKQ